jgi:hypothetical protein
MKTFSASAAAAVVSACGYIIIIFYFWAAAHSFMTERPIEWGIRCKKKCHCQLWALWKVN